MILLLIETNVHLDWIGRLNEGQYARHNIVTRCSKMLQVQWIFVEFIDKMNRFANLYSSQFSIVNTLTSLCLCLSLSPSLYLNLTMDHFVVHVHHFQVISSLKLIVMFLCIDAIFVCIFCSWKKSTPFVIRWMVSLLAINYYIFYYGNKWCDLQLSKYMHTYRVHKTIIRSYYTVKLFALVFLPHFFA